MNSKEKITNALKAKGWKPTLVDYEPVCYYTTGREGGWTIEFDTERTPYWAFDGIQNKIYDAGIIADFDDGILYCYNQKDALKCIEIIPVNNFTTYDD